MASPGNRGAAKAKHLRVLLPFTCDALRIPDEVAVEIGAEEALIVGPASGKVIWPVEVGQDGDGAFLGRGWPEFAGSSSSATAAAASSPPRRATPPSA
ncbi:hypothetical protein GQ55_7G097900 [Panicum hallii var. hallii]|uniref:TF-B3 domain-containing protein n=1 Tax=Panicum hallii var. hallii TaxID=1504633 RepID=A0A2T7CTI8_9POAL|nr:hypothetical protein GQ55_7G097900 [Panicum hallii var. hallii]